MREADVVHTQVGHTQAGHTKVGQQGVALISALLFMALILALVMGLTMTSISELGVTKTYNSQTIALQAAEAGLNHATSLIVNYQGVNNSTIKLFDQLLADRSFTDTTQYRYFEGNNPFVAGKEGKYQGNVIMIDYNPATQKGFQLRSNWSPEVLVPDAYYRVSLIDDEPSTSTASPKVPNFKPGTTYLESTGASAHNATIDKNNRVVLYSTGTYLNTSVTLEGWVGFLPYPAFAANKNISIGGQSVISGTYGGVHSNSNLLADGASWHVDQSATAVGQLIGEFDGNVDGFYGGGQEVLDLPEFVTQAPLVANGPATSPRLQDFLIRQAHTILIDPGFADKAHKTDPGGADSNGTAGSPATRALASLAARLGLNYAQLADAIDTTPLDANGVRTNPHVEQTTAVAIKVREPRYVALQDGQYVDVPSQPVTPTRYTTTTDSGWGYSNATSPWDIINNAAIWNLRDARNDRIGQTVYVVGRDNFNLNNPNSSSPNGGNVKLKGNVGANGDPLPVTIMVTGSIEVTGNTNVVANLRALSTPMLPPFVKIDVLMFAVEDIKVSGDGTNITFSGVSYAGEQVELRGNGSINGQMLSFSNQNVNNSLVQGVNGDVNASLITGNFELTLNDGNAVGKIKLYSWRQIKQ